MVTRTCLYVTFIRTLAVVFSSLVVYLPALFSVERGKLYIYIYIERERAGNNWGGRESGLLQGTVVGTACRDRGNAQRTSFEVTSPSSRRYSKVTPETSRRERFQSSGVVNWCFSISNFRRVLNAVCFLLGNSPASELYMPTFRNALSHLRRQLGVKITRFEKYCSIYRGKGLARTKPFSL